MLESCINGNCCGQWNSVIHFVAGVGVGFLVVDYFKVGNLGLMGWVLVILGILGHFVKM